ncbi:type IV pilus minor pilin PilX [Geomonas limicola]|uniref:Type IV pilus minor pilin PilX n=1 Tax=Geomonas limicola TaxID=2740186 RepID=A0A6V8N5D9_9BACT|nr:pilus assembly PilX N-terminal domain-containing protein [Geomonas limicola]GFO66833.1 type IV pilus minor pilin PilX [Geomonas limicola]
MVREREKGAALVTALMLTVLSLVIALALLYTITAGTKISASQKRYRTALAAAHGGVELVTQELMPRILQNSLETPNSLQNQFELISLRLPGYSCLQQKLALPPGAWSACSPAQRNADPALSPDFAFSLGGAKDSHQGGYQVAVKILDSVPGNTDSAANDLLDPGSAVTGTEEGIRPQHVPGLFNIAVQGVGGAPREKARLSLLYAY